MILLFRCVWVFKELRIEARIAGLVFLVLSFVSYFNSGQSYLLSICLLLGAIGGLDMRPMMKRCAIALLCVIAVLGIAQLIQFALSGELPGSVERENGRLRLSFYLEHPNTLAAMASMSLITLLSLSKSVNGRFVIAGILMAAAVFAVTDSKTSAALIVFFILMRVLLAKIGNRFFRFELGAYIAIPIVLSILVLGLMFGVFPTFVYDLFQNLLTGRPGYWILQLNVAGGLSIFGHETLYGDQYINGWLYPSVTIDCFYAAAVLQLGAWSLFSFVYFYARAGKIYLRRCEYGMFCALATVALFGLTEVHMVDPAICLPIVFLGVGLFNSSSGPLNKTCNME